MSSNKKLILVIGATGAQGMAVIDQLLAPSVNGDPSPFIIRALTRDPESRRAQELKAKGVECVKGAFDDFPSVLNALQCAYGAYVNTDTFTVGEVKELFAGVRIFELAKQVKTLRHYVWSSLDYSSKDTGYNPDYRVEHYDGKGRVGDFLRQQPSEPTDTGLSWSQLTSGPYMDMLTNVKHLVSSFVMYQQLISPLQYNFGPLNKRPDGTYVFASPIGDGHVPMVALEDLGYFARYIFDHRVETSGKDLKIASDMVGWDYLVSTFTKVTGQPAVYVRQTTDEWVESFVGADEPLANEQTVVTEDTNTFSKNFKRWWALFRDDVVKRDLDWIRSVNPDGYTLESWMREKDYTGELNPGLLKNSEDVTLSIHDSGAIQSLSGPRIDPIFRAPAYT
ncbi:NAD(P)-binding protein [Panus rudis PR-1116 ss-1]|nr:NAD(P)-binding protein [Panus rudis PR-1116 ss-1]